MQDEVSLCINWAAWGGGRIICETSLNSENGILVRTLLSEVATPCTQRELSLYTHTTRMICRHYWFQS